MKHLQSHIVVTHLLFQISNEHLLVFPIRLNMNIVIQYLSTNLGVLISNLELFAIVIQVQKEIPTLYL